MATIDRPGYARAACPMPHPLVCEAIASRCLVTIWYGQGWRVVEPFVHGWTAEGFQGSSACTNTPATATRDSPQGWKSFYTDRIQVIEVLHDVRLICARTGTRHFPPSGLVTVCCHAGP